MFQTLFKAFHVSYGSENLVRQVLLLHFTNETALERSAAVLKWHRCEVVGLMLNLTSA